jgi:polar amino acid transport system substrate-binding protein
MEFGCAVRKIIRGVGGVCAALVAVLSGEAVAQQKIRLVAGPDYAPYVDEASAGGGIATEVLRAALETQGRSIVVEFLPWRRGWQAVQDLTYDGTYPYSITPDREQQVLFSRPVVTVRTRVYFARSGADWWQGPDSAGGRSYCRPDGWSDPPAMAGREDVRRVSVADLAACLRLLANQRVDFIIGDPLILEPMAVEIGLLERLRRGPVVTEVPLSVAVARTHPQARQLIETINGGLSVVFNNGVLDKILLKNQ